MEHVPHFLVFGIHVRFVLLVAGHLYRIAVHHFYTVMVQSEYLHRIVGHQDQLTDTQIRQDGTAHIVVAQIGLEAEGQIGLHSIHSPVLQLIGAELVDQSDAAALLTQIQQHSPAGLLDTA